MGFLAKQKSKREARRTMKTRLSELKEMREDGLIDDDEFDAKKAQLLESI